MKKNELNQLQKEVGKIVCSMGKTLKKEELTPKQLTDVISFFQHVVTSLETLKRIKEM